VPTANQTPVARYVVYPDSVSRKTTMVEKNTGGDDEPLILSLQSSCAYRTTRGYDEEIEILARKQKILAKKSYRVKRLHVAAWMKETRSHSEIDPNVQLTTHLTETKSILSGRNSHDFSGQSTVRTMKTVKMIFHITTTPPLSRIKTKGNQPVTYAKAQHIPDESFSGSDKEELCGYFQFQACKVHLTGFWTTSATYCTDLTRRGKET
jgi:hypothetical protein